LKEALPALKNEHFDVLDATPRKLLVDLCEKKRDSYNRSLLVNALIQHLPLGSVSKAKVVASYFVLYCRFMECLFPGVPITGSVDEYSLEHIREWMQDQDVSQIENLDLSCSYIEVLPVEIFSRLQNIKTLNFSSNNTFSKLIIESIKILSSLEELDLSNNSFNSIPLTVFDKLPFLKKVDLRDNPLRTEELESIKAYFGNRSEVELLI
jgi:Leucine-rich repeat (LRR) protein